MKLTKKVTAMAMASCMILSMTACGGSNEESTNNQETQTEATEEETTS